MSIFEKKKKNHPQCNKIHFFIHSIMNAILRKHKKCIFAPELVVRLPPKKVVNNCYGKQEITSSIG